MTVGQKVHPVGYRLGVIYDDEYRCIAGAWKIVATRSRILAVVSGRDEAATSAA